MSARACVVRARARAANITNCLPATHTFINVMLLLFCSYVWNAIYCEIGLIEDKFEMSLYICVCVHKICVPHTHTHTFNRYLCGREMG